MPHSSPNRRSRIPPGRRSTHCAASKPIFLLRLFDSRMVLEVLPRLIPQKAECVDAILVCPFHMQRTARPQDGENHLAFRDLSPYERRPLLKHPARQRAFARDHVFPRHRRAGECANVAD